MGCAQAARPANTTMDEITAVLRNELRMKISCD
jgi:hypothetical protein